MLDVMLVPALLAALAVTGTVSHAPEDQGPDSTSFIDRVLEMVREAPSWKHPPGELDVSLVRELIEQGILSAHPASWAVPYPEERAD